MITTSSAWKEYIKNSSVFHVKATMTGGSTLQLTDSDFMMGSVSFTDSMSGMNEIALGSVVTNTFNATLNNNDGKFDSWDWTEIEVWFGIEVNGSEEWIKRGKYTIDRPSSIGNTIKIECYDYMDKLNTYYSLVTDITYPLEASRVVYYMCQYCGVDYDFAGTTGWQFDNSFNVNTAFADLNDEATTCRQVLSWILQTMGGYARINPSNGKLECKAWNRSQWSTADVIEGGVFQVWNATTAYSGGTMNPWSVVTDRNGGTFFDGGGAYALEKIKQQTIMIDDIEVTGIRAFTYNTVDEFDFATAGSGGYILGIQDNPLVGSGSGNDKQTIADRAWANVQGLKVRPFNASMFGDPSIEAGDTIILRDAKDNYYVSIITNLTFSLGNDMRVSCDAETAETNQLQTANPTTSAIKGAVTASYDYLKAQKISADYIDAGTITGAVIAKNLTMDGGSVNLATDSATTDVISLKYGDDIATMRGGHFEIRTQNSDTLRGELGVSSDTHAAVKIYNANGKCVSTMGESSTGGGFQGNDSNGNVRCLFTPSSLGSGAIMLYNSSNARTVAIDAYSPAMQLFNSSGTTYTIALNGANGAVFAASYNNTSSVDLKKNIKKADSMLSKILDADILSYNYKGESKGTKSHIGLAIGGEYNVPEEVIAESDDGELSGVDLYAMVSMAWKAIQEQSEKIEALEKRVAELESLNEKKEK